jgi:hypothetical protein
MDHTFLYRDRYDHTVTDTIHIRHIYAVESKMG